MRQRYKGLRDWREQNDVKLEEVADLTQYSPSYLSRVERGERELPALARIRLARVLRVRVSELFPVS